MALSHLDVPVSPELVRQHAQYRGIGTPVINITISYTYTSQSIPKEKSI